LRHEVCRSCAHSLVGLATRVRLPSSNDVRKIVEDAAGCVHHGPHVHLGSWERVGSQRVLAKIWVPCEVSEGVMLEVARCTGEREAPSGEACGFSRRGELRRAGRALALVAAIRVLVITTGPLIV